MKEDKVIFIVDDDPIHRLLMDKLFAKQQKKYQLYFFENGQLAIDALSNEGAAIPDLILLDIEMPVMNGWQFIEAFEALNAAFKEQIAIYMVTSSFSDEDQERVKTYPLIKDYIVKPIRIEKINELLR